MKPNIPREKFGTRENEGSKQVDNNGRGSNIPCEKVQQSVDNKQTRADRMFVSHTKTTLKSV